MQSDHKIIEKAGELARQERSSVELRHIKAALTSAGRESSDEAARRVLNNFGMEYTGSEVMALNG